ncbi:unnamed protein product, partial [Polarella glacialis]
PLLGKMALLRLHAGLMLLGLHFVAAQDSEVTSLAANKLMDLSDEALDSTVKDGKGPVFVKFFAPWCKHCKDMANDWHELAKQDWPDDLRVARIDCTKDPDARKKYGFSGYPTLLMFETGGAVMRKYQGDRSLASMADFCRGGWKDAPVHDPNAPQLKRTWRQELMRMPWSIKMVFGLFALGFPAAIFAACWDVRQGHVKKAKRRAERQLEMAAMKGNKAE